MEKMELGPCDGLTDLSALQNMNELKELKLFRNYYIVDISPLGATNLKTLSIIDCAGVVDVSYLKNCAGKHII